MLWAGDIEDVFNVLRSFGGGGLAFYGGHGAEDLVGDVGQDGGAAGRDAIFGEKEEQAGEEFVDGAGGGEFFEAAGEGGGEIGFGVYVGRVATAESGSGAGDKFAAATV
jgi:hypothetical protein